MSPSSPRVFGQKWKVELVPFKNDCIPPGFPEDCLDTEESRAVVFDWFTEREDPRADYVKNQSWIPALHTGEYLFMDSCGRLVPLKYAKTDRTQSIPRAVGIYLGQGKVHMHSNIGSVQGQLLWAEENI